MFRDHIPGDDKETRINTNDASIMLVCINGYQENLSLIHILNIGIPDAYVEHGNVSVLREGLGIDSDSIIKTMKSRGYLD